MTEEHSIVSDEEIRLDNTWHLSGKELGLLLLAVGLQLVEVLDVQLGSFEDAGTRVFRLGQEFLASMTLNFFCFVDDGGEIQAGAFDSGKF